MKRSQVTVAEYLTNQIQISGVPQKDIADAVGYQKPNMITMLKQGKTKVPMNKIAPLSKVLGVDPLHFLRIAMQEYSPETWTVLESLLGQRLFSEGEQQIIEVVREYGEGHNVYLTNDTRREELAALISKWAKEEVALATPKTTKVVK